MNLRLTIIFLITALLFHCCYCQPENPALGEPSEAEQIQSEALAATEDPPEQHLLPVEQPVQSIDTGNCLRNSKAT